MNLDLDTFLVALYTTVDDLYQEHIALHKPRRPGHRAELTDSEVLTIVISGQWSGHSERWIVRHAKEHWQAYFPRLLSQSATNRRARDLAGVLVHLVPAVASRLEAELSAYQVMDSLPVPLLRQCRGRKHRLFANEADVGVGGADKVFYYGCRLLLDIASSGAITGFLLGPASTNDRWMAENLLCWKTNPYWSPWTAVDIPHLNKRKNGGMTGPKGPIWPRDAVGSPSSQPYIADAGFGGALWEDHWARDYDVRVLTPQGYRGQGADRARAQHKVWRHVVETVNAHLEDDLHLHFPKAKSTWGLLTRIAAKLVAFNLGIWLNRIFGRPDLAIATIFSS